MNGTIKEAMLRLLAENVDCEGESRPRREAIALAVLDKAMKGDLNAVNFVRELTEKEIAELEA